MVSSARSAVVVSFFDERPRTHLDALVKRLSGIDCSRFLVVNSNRQREQKVFADSGWTVIVRPNLGMNIGAWSAAIPYLYEHEMAVFLQDECQVVSDDFFEAYARALAKTKVGMVGESINPKWLGRWNDISASPLNYRIQVGEHGASMARVDFYLGCMESWGIAAGNSGRHLRALIWAFRGDVLKQLKHFPLGGHKEECIAAEIAVSKHVEQLDLLVEQVDPIPFRYIQHAEWRSDGLAKRVV